MPGLEDTLGIESCLRGGYSIEALDDIPKGAKCRMTINYSDGSIKLEKELKEKILTVILRLKGEEESIHILHFTSRDIILRALNIDNAKDNIKVTIEEEPL